MLEHPMSDFMMAMLLEQVLSCLAEQVNGKAEEYENRGTTGRNMLGDNIINIIPTNKENFQVG